METKNYVFAGRELTLREMQIISITATELKAIIKETTN